MRHRVAVVGVALVGLALALPLVPRVAATMSLREADRFYAQKSYAKALVGYQDALAKGAVGDRKTEIAYRVAISLGRARKWDQALAATRRFVAQHPSGLWGARGQYWLGQLLTVVPHHAYQVGDRFYRGEDYPKDTAEKPQPLYLGDKDRGNAIAAFEQAKAEFERLAPRRGREEADLNFDLARLLARCDLNPMLRALFALEKQKRPGLVLRWGEADPVEVKRLRNRDWTPTPAKPYDASQPLPQRILGLYQQVERLDPKCLPQARLAQAVYLREYQASMQSQMRAYDERKKQRVSLPYPYQKNDAIALAQSIADDLPEHALAPQAQLLAGQWLEEANQFLRAIQAYQRIPARWPNRKWVSDARAQIQSITWPSLSLEGRSRPVGEKPLVALTGRNVKTISFTAYRVQLEQLLSDKRFLYEEDSYWANFEAAFGSATNRLWRRHGRKVAEWTYVTQDKGDHRHLQEELRAPLTEPGAYVIEADSGEAHAATLVLITDLAIVTKTDSRRHLAFVCNARTGRPEPGADVILREAVQPDDEGWRVSVGQGQANEDGFFSKELMTVAKDCACHELQAFAWVGDRYAVSRGNGGGRERGDTRPEYRGHVSTDRPVYRPGHAVYFRVIMMTRTQDGQRSAVGAWRVAKDQEFTVRITDSRGEEVLKRTYTADEFGAFSGSLVLGSEPPLGVYQLSVATVGDRSVPLNGNQFRVEEYKKPEFEVKVVPAAEQLRVGQQVKAEIEARYYFGSPVVGGRVKYRVYQTPYHPGHHFPRPYDWLVRRGEDGESYQPPYQEGEVVKQGDGTTDAQGRLSLEFATSSGGRSPEARAYTYTIAAEVTDPSRRVIEGTGEVRAGKQQFFAFLDAKRGFYQAGDRIEIEVATRDVMDRPISASGRIALDRVIYGAAPEDVIDAHFADESVTTDKEGRGFVRWTVPEAGYYRFQFQAKDGWDETVTGKTYTWVHGEDMTRRKMRLQGIELIPEQRTYREGETCRLLVVSNLPDITLLLTQEGGHQIIAKAVLPVTGKSRVIEIPIHQGHVPDFRFSAVAVKDWQAYAAETEVFVPAADRFLDISISAERPTYRPGEKATFHLKATDSRGRPVRTSVSLGIADASVYYIQPDFARDPRTYFYGDRRSAEVNQRWSLEESLGGSDITDRKEIPYKQHEFAAPEGLGQLQDWPPDLLGWELRSYQHRFRELGRIPATYAYEAPPALPAMMRGGVGGTGGGGARAGRAELRPAGQLDSLKLGFAAGAPSRTGPAPAGPLVAAQVRTRFADTAFWSPSVLTGADGTAAITVEMPENLTTWRATARAVTTEAQVGQATGETITRKDLIVRLQAPRFFVERDLVVLSATVHNYLQSEKRAKVSLVLEGGTLELVNEIPADLGLKAPATEAELWVDVPKDGERRVDWVVRVAHSGLALVRMTAQTDEESDATQLQFPALVHGAEKLLVQTGVMRDVKGTQAATLKLTLPKERQRGATELNLQLTPSLAAVALDALPYLADYPYGCIEQTMSRFLPSVTVARTLKDLGLDLTDLQKRAQAYADERDPAKGSQASRDSAYTYPKGMPGSMDPAELAKRLYLRRPSGPIFAPGQLDAMVKEGLARIYNQQHADGGWGWWQTDLSDPYMTAYVCSGLFTAREAGYHIKDDVLEKGFQFLLKEIRDEDNLHRLAYLASVITLRGSVDDKVKGIISDRLYRNRLKLTVYSQALLALSLKQVGEVEKARVVVDNLENSARIDRENGTASWTGSHRWWWHWWDDPIETNAAVLRAYVAVYPEGDLAPMIVKWMVNNRRGNHWHSTKSTALAVHALADYIRARQELAPDYTITVDLDGKVRRTYRVTRDNALYFDNRFLVGDEMLGDGEQTLTITVRGSGTLYYSVYLRYFSLEEDLKGVGNEIFVSRRYFLLTPRLVTKQEKQRKWQELVYDRKELPSGALLKSGDMLEVELVLDAKNDYEYVVFEDMKPAGCEPVELRSGAGEGEGVYSHMELRDEKVAFFIAHLPQGTRAVRYRLRAEIPGRFHALPTNGYAMYAPDVRCLSDEWRVGIADQ